MQVYSYFKFYYNYARVSLPFKPRFYPIGYLFLRIRLYVLAIYYLCLYLCAYRILTERNRSSPLYICFLAQRCTGVYGAAYFFCPNILRLLCTAIYYLCMCISINLWRSTGLYPVVYIAFLDSIRLASLSYPIDTYVF